MREKIKDFIYWPRVINDPVRRYWHPWWIIGWRMIWFLPSIISKCFFVAFVSIGWGFQAGRSMWRLAK